MSKYQLELTENEKILWELEQRILLFFKEKIFITNFRIIYNFKSVFESYFFENIETIEHDKNYITIITKEKKQKILTIKHHLQKDFFNVLSNATELDFDVSEEQMRDYINRLQIDKNTKQKLIKEFTQTSEKTIQSLNKKSLEKQIEKQRSQQIKIGEVALNSPTFKENLPFPFVHYPNHYGTFFSFSETENSQKFFCECNRNAIDNCLELHECVNENGNLINNLGLRINFSNDIILAGEEGRKKDEIFQYKEKLCHRCNLQIPALDFCVEMYGTKFVQKYGWYIQANKYRNGFYRGKFLPGKCPSNIAEKLSQIPEFIDHETSAYAMQQNFNGQHSEEEGKNFIKIAKEIHKTIENETRAEFGVKKIGEGWIGETLLYNIVCDIFNNEEILRHYRPDWMEGLELDVYVPSRKIAFEYQGQQHFFPVKHWGGEKALKGVQERDKKKKELCQKLGIQLIEVFYYESLSKELIEEKIKSTPKQSVTH